MSDFQPSDAFQEEARDLVSELETALLALEEMPEDQGLVDRVFRAMHTLKGSGAMFGFDAVAAFTHDLETVFDLVREGRLPVSTALINLTLHARDHIQALLDAAAGGPAADDAEGRAIGAALRDLMGAAALDDRLDAKVESHDASAPSGANAPDNIDVSPDTLTYRIRFAPHEDIFLSGSNPLNLINELADMGSLQTHIHMDAIPTLDAMDPERCYASWDMELTTAGSIEAIRDVFIFVEDRCRLSIEVIDAPDAADADTDYKRLGQILVERGDLTAAQLQEALERQKPIGEMLVAAGAVDRGKVQAALAEQQLVRETRQQRREAQEAASLRVPAGKLDTLVNLVGELVTANARLNQAALQSGDANLNDIAEVIERLTADLRDNTMSIRMLPIENAFSKLRRLVRDLARDLGKEVALTTAGGDTELDKTVIEQLNDPLVHIIRNSIDHGIEMPEQRTTAGKPAQGNLHLSAEHSGSHVVIRITDDGAGLNPAGIRAKAEEKGLIAPGAELDEKSLYALIFTPGFSTAQSVTSVSGRGVGMDVVKRAIENLRGTIDVESKPGQGATITLKLPLTLAIIDGLLVSVAESTYVLPLAAIEECLELSVADLERACGRNILNLRGEIVPFITLRERFGVNGAPPALQQVIVGWSGDRRVGIVVDQVVGEQQIVIKTMSRLYQQVEEISGATILGDGSVALILDMARLLIPVNQPAMAA